MKQRKKVVVTGGAGFIGSHLAEELVRRGCNVTIVDDLSTGKMENLASLLETESVDFVQGSITDLPLLQELFQGVDYIFHQAAIASVFQSIEAPLVSHDVNLSGTLKVLLAAKDNDVRKVIFASSSSVYGDDTALPQKEDNSPNPQSPYAVSKLAGECYCRVFQDVYGLPTVCLRYFNVYGPRCEPDSQYAAVIPRFISRVSRGEPPIIYGDGEQTRDFVFVNDVVEANILAAHADVNGIFNIGSGESITINQLAKLIISSTGNGLKPIHSESNPGDVRQSLADIFKAKALGYAPRYSLERGLRELCSALRQSTMSS